MNWDTDEFLAEDMDSESRERLDVDARLGGRLDGARADPEDCVMAEEKTGAAALPWPSR